MISPWVFAAIFENTANPYMVVDRDLRYVAANRAYCEVTATPREKLIGYRLFEVFPNDPADPNNANALLLRRSLERVFETGQADVIPSITYRVPEQMPHGLVETERIWSATHTPLLNEYGRVAYVLQHTVDVTALAAGMRQPVDEQGVLERAKKVSADNQALRLESEQLRTLFEQAPGFMCVLRGPTHVFELANAAYLELVGGRDIVGKTVAEALPEVASQGFVDLLDRTYRSGEAYVARQTPIQLARGGRLEQHFLDFIYQPMLEDGRAVGIFVMGVDVSEGKSLKQEVETATAESRFMADLAPVMLWTADVEGRVTWANRAMEEALGDPAGWLTSVHPDDLGHVQDSWRQSVATGQPWEAEFRLRLIDRSYRWFIARASPLKSGDQSIAKWFGNNVDIDHIKTAQQQRERLISELELKNRELDRFAYVASHDLKAPLRGIANISQWIAEDLGEALEPQVKENLKHLEARVVRLQKLIDGILTYSRSLEGSGDVRDIDPQSLLAELTSLASPPPGSSLELIEPFPAFRAPLLPVMQVLLNLVGNAFKHAPGTPVRLRAVSLPSGLRIEVTDEGPGIAPEHHARIWELFQTLGPPRPGNTGIGLSIVRRIVESLGGQVGLESAEGSGARFFFTLPQ